MNNLLHHPASLTLVGLALPILVLAAYVASLVVPVIMRTVVPAVVESVVS